MQTKFDALKEVVEELKPLLLKCLLDLQKVKTVNASASQRVRVITIEIARLSKIFRSISMECEKEGIFIEQRRLRNQSKKKRN